MADRRKAKHYCLATTETIKKDIAGIKESGGNSKWDKSAGTVEAWDADEVVVLRALQKGKDEPWIAMFYDSERVQWEPEGEQK